MIVFDVYEGDRYAMTGTLEEVASHYKVKPGTVRWWTTPTAEKRNSRKRAYPRILKRGEKIGAGFDGD